MAADQLATKGPWSPGQPVRLDTAPYVLRSLTKEDASERFCGWLADAEVQRFLNSPPVSANVQAVGLHISASDNRSSFLIGIFDPATADSMVGFHSVICDLTNGTAEVIPVVGDRAYWGKGVVSATLPPLLDFLFDRVGLEKVWSRPMARDFASVRNFLALGFRCEGVLRGQLRSIDGSRADQFFFGLPRKEWRGRRRGATS